MSKTLEADRIAKIKQDLTKFYLNSEDYYAHLDGHIEEQIEHFQFGNTRLTDWLEKAQSILEVGSGSGILLYRLKKQYPDKSMSGVDLSPIGVKMAQDRVRKDNLDITFKVSDVEKEIPYPINSFDMVICNEVLEHLTHPQDAITHMSQMLRPGGHLVLVFPNRAIRAPGKWKVQKFIDTLHMMVNPQAIPVRFETPPFHQIGEDADATYLAHPWEVHRMVKQAGLQIVYRSLFKGRLIAKK